MAGSAQDVEAGRAYITLYLRRTDYDQQVDDLKRSEGDDRPSAAIANAAGQGGASLSYMAKEAVVYRLAGDAASATVVKLGIASAATAPALAATGAAAAAAAVGFGAIAAVAGVVYVALFKWDELPFVVKALMLAFSPLVVVIRAAVLAFKALKLAVAIVTAPIWLTVKAIKGLYAAILTLPRAITATIKLMKRLSVAAVEMAVKVTKAAATIPGRIARATSSALRDVGASLAKIGATRLAVAGALVGSATLAAKSWAAYGETLRRVQNDLQRFQLTAEEASIIARVSQRTGESMERLAEQIRDGTRDFSRWRHEMSTAGTLMSGAGLSAALALSRAYFSLRESVIGLKDTIGAALGPALTEGAELFSGMVRGITRWVSENKPLVVQVFKIASAVVIAAGVITTLGGAIAGAGTVVSPFVAWLAMLAGVMAIVEVKTEAGRSVWTAYGDSVRRVYGTVAQYLGQMMEFTDRVIGGITDALMAGDLAAAVDVMWSAAKVAWISALLEIDELTSGTFGGILQSLASGKWAAAGESLVGVLTEVWINIEGAADTAWTGILSGFDTLVSEMKKGLSGFLDWAITNVFTPLATATGKIPELGVGGRIAGGAGGGIVGGLAGFGIGGIGGGLAGVAVGGRAGGGIAGAMDDAVSSLEKAARLSLESLMDTSGALKRSMAEPGADREGSLADRRAAREREITALRERQAELAQHSGEQAERERTANQKALDASLAAAKAARDAAAENKLKEEDFAVSQAVQSITRFSGEAMGLSIGRTSNPAERTAKLTADQLKEIQGLRKDMANHEREILRLIAMGGFE